MTTSERDRLQVAARRVLSSVFAADPPSLVQFHNHKCRSTNRISDTQLHIRMAAFDVAGQLQLCEFVRVAVQSLMCECDSIYVRKSAARMLTATFTQDMSTTLLYSFYRMASIAVPNLSAVVTLGELDEIQIDFDSRCDWNMAGEERRRHVHYWRPTLKMWMEAIVKIDAERLRSERLIDFIKFVLRHSGDCQPIEFHTAVAHIAAHKCDDVIGSCPHPVIRLFYEWKL